MFPGGHGDFGADDVTEADTQEVGAWTESQEMGAAFSPGGRSSLLSCSHDTLLRCVSVCMPVTDCQHQLHTFQLIFSRPSCPTTFSECFFQLLRQLSNLLAILPVEIHTGKRGIHQPTPVWAEFPWVTSPPGEADGLASLLQGRQRLGAWGGVTWHRPRSPVSTSI